MKCVKIDGLVFSISLLASRHVVSNMPRVPYENHSFILNSALNVQALDSAPASTSTFALDNATRQLRRRAESMPWSHQTSILRSRQNSLQLKPFPKALPTPHFVEAEHNRDMEMRQDGLGDMERHDYFHTT
jgi:hypothetical protein